jgi:hypothetical protein
MTQAWSEWRLFPDPRQCGILVAPVGPGCYELRYGEQLILYGQSRNVAYRMTSLLPKRWGCGTRYNEEKQNYVFTHLGRIEYRTLACDTPADAKIEEAKLRSQGKYLFKD